MITLAEAKAQLVVDHTDDDSLIVSLINSAEAMVASYTNRVMDTATKTMILDGFPSVITLDAAPFVSLTSIVYNDTDDAEQTLSASLYTVDARGTYAKVTPVYGADWPSTTAAPQSVTVTFVAGYSTPSEPLKQAALMYLSSLYEQRENHITGVMANKVPVSAEYLMQPYRIYPV